MATLVGISALGPFQFDTYLPALPALMIFLNTSDTMVQLTITASLLGMATGQLFVGPLIDALGRRRPLIVALAVFILAAVACLMATSVTWMIVARFVLVRAGSRPRHVESIQPLWANQRVLAGTQMHRLGRPTRRCPNLKTPS